MVVSTAAQTEMSSSVSFKFSPTKEQSKAEALLGLATRLYPDAVLAIKRVLKFPSNQ
jgi:hypothetical protein